MAYRQVNIEVVSKRELKKGLWYVFRGNDMAKKVGVGDLLDYGSDKYLVRVEQVIETRLKDIPAEVYKRMWKKEVRTKEGLVAYWKEQVERWKNRKTEQIENEVFSLLKLVLVER